MNTQDQTYPTMVSSASPETRASFIRQTYSHLAGAILVFVGITGFILSTPLAAQLTQLMFSGKYSWLIVMGMFMGVSMLANKWAFSGTSLGKQYAGLALYTVAEAIIFVPILMIAQLQYPGIIAQAGLMTGLMLAGLTTIVFLTRKDFNFLTPILTIAGFVALGVIVFSIVIGFDLGLLFSALMILFATGAILRDTSNVMLHYRTDQYVAASLSLFASVALLFWYILNLLMRLRD
ncbi:Bax inhibitor-1 family protein [Kiritimatiellota bacterium B12222]|nr:Bax inhibitor-1 family protein [Kiritimatiellota bacterium B12222]